MTNARAPRVAPPRVSSRRPPVLMPPSSVRLLASQVDRRSMPDVARCFNGPTIRRLHAGERDASLTATIEESRVAAALGAGATLADAYQVMFAALLNSYRNEYVYRAAITSKLFLARHNPATTALFGQVEVAGCRADAVMFNGTSTAYEIKTEFDNVSRLSAQLDAYCSAFDRVYVLTHRSHLADVLRVAPDHVGVLLLSPAFTIQTVRPASSNVRNLDAGSMFDLLRKEEYLVACQRLFGRVPDVPPVRLYRACRELFCQADSVVAHEEVVRLVKLRRHVSRQEVASVPSFLAAACMDSGVPPRLWGDLARRLSSTPLAC